MSEIPAPQDGGEGPAVEVEPGKSAGMARMVAFLMEPAVLSNRSMVARMQGSLAFKVTDQNAGATIKFCRGRVEVKGDVDPDASITVEAPLLTLGALGEGSHAIRGLIRREIKLKGALWHPLLIIRLRKLMRVPKSS